MDPGRSFALHRRVGLDDRLIRANEASPTVRVDRRTVGAWAFFDFANSIYPAVVTATVFSIFFVDVVVGSDDGRGELWWGRAVSLSALVVALASPLLGAIADRSGARKRFLISFVAICLVGVAMMPTLEAGMLARGFLLFVIANIGFESALVFYNAYLPDIAPPEQQGRVSGLGFGLGYLGSTLGLLVVLPFASDRIEVVWLLVVGFFLLFSIPAFRYLPADNVGEMRVSQAAARGASNLMQVVAEVWRLKDLRNFLIAYFFFIDAVLTIIVMAGVVAQETFGFTRQGVIVLFLIVQCSAMAGALTLGKPTDSLGPKKVLNGMLSLWIAACIAAYFVEGQTAFYVLAVVAGFGLGSVQSASRVFMSSLIPEGKEAEMFGFYAFCGKSSSVLGPLLFGGAVYLAGGNQRPGFLVLASLFVIGLVLLQRAGDPRAA